MNAHGRMVLLVHEAYREDDWRRADHWRRLHARHAAPPVQAAQAVDEASRSRLSFLRRLNPASRI